VDEEPNDAIANAKLPAGLEAEGRDEDLETGDLVHPSGRGPHGHTTPPGTSLPEEKEDSD
jgi:hypothetical protein